MTTPRVFLVDPFPDECDMYAEYFRFAGWAVCVHDTPESAFAAAKIDPPDAIVTRILQPQHYMDGVALTDAIKSNASTRRVAVIVITTSTSAAHNNAALAAGCDAYVLLPSTPDVLVNHVRSVLQRRAPGGVNPLPPAPPTT